MDISKTLKILKTWFQHDVFLCRETHYTSDQIWFLIMFVLLFHTANDARQNSITEAHSKSQTWVSLKEEKKIC